MVNWKALLIGDGERYNYGQLCIPTVPWKKNRPKLNFYAKDEPIPLLLAALMGLQHCFAMVGGLITPPLVVFRFAVCGFPFCPPLEQYAISAGLISSGVCSLINVTKLSIPFTERFLGRQLYLGSGVLSVMGTSFTFLPIFEIAISQMKASGMSGTEAYGAMLGTSMLCSLVELFLSMLPVRFIKRIFPPLVTSITVMLIGIALTGTGMKYWGGGVVCAEMGWKTHSQVVALNITDELPPPSAVCTTYGDKALYYGAPEYIGLGFSVLCMLVILELFGSVFMKNCNVIIALLFGYMIAGVSNYNGYPYLNKDNLANAEPITFLWVYTFPLSIYGPAIIPLLISYLVTTVETVGDITATYEASQLKTDSMDYQTSVQGGLTQDSVSSILAGLFTTMPNTTFSQNNGVISLTKCASRRAGIACGMWLIFMGIFGKIAGFFTSIPDAVLGGMTIFLFANVLSSGIALTASVDLHSRRNKFILAMSMAVGVGVTVWPYAFMDMRASPYTAWFWPCSDCSDTVKGVRDGISIFLSTGYCVGTVIAMILNGVLPEDAGISYSDDFFKDEVDVVLEDKTEITNKSMISTDKSIAMLKEESASSLEKREEAPSDDDYVEDIA